jgi:hypothetical protein
MLLKKLTKLTQEFATKVVLEVSIETLKKLGIREQVAEEMIEQGVFDNEDTTEPEIQDEDPEEQEQCEEDEQNESVYLVTKNYDMLPVHGAKSGVYALCVQVVDITTGEAYWVPYQFVQKKAVEKDVME